MTGNKTSSIISHATMIIRRGNPPLAKAFFNSSREKCSNLCSTLCFIDEKNDLKELNMLLNINDNYVMLNEREIKLLILEEIKTDVDEQLQSIIVEKVKREYLSGSPQKKKRAKEIESRAKKDTDDPSAYRPFATDKDPKTGKPIKTKPSRWNKEFEKKFGSKKKAKNESMTYEEDIFEDSLLEEIDVDLEILREFISEAILLDEKKGANVTQALKNKAEKANAPMGALRAIYNKGLAAWRTGHRPGASQHAWAMARVNSVLAGGPARKVDAAQWKRIQKHRGKKRKKK